MVCTCGSRGSAQLAWLASDGGGQSGQIKLLSVAPLTVSDSPAQLFSNVIAAYHSPGSQRRARLGKHEFSGLSLMGSWNVKDVFEAVIKWRCLVYPSLKSQGRMTSPRSLATLAFDIRHTFFLVLKALDFGPLDFELSSPLHFCSTEKAQDPLTIMIHQLCPIQRPRFFKHLQKGRPHTQ